MRSVLREFKSGSRAMWGPRVVSLLWDRTRALRDESDATTEGTRVRPQLLAFRTIKSISLRHKNELGGGD